MCEIFGLCASRSVRVNDYLKEFFSHSNKHPNGWGLALLDGNTAQIEREPIQASKSYYLHERLSADVSGKNIFAHIRFATIGDMEYNNCHPFTEKDDSGRLWTLVHNGTIFGYDKLNGYTYVQKGQTDSERVLLYIVDEINNTERQRGRLNAKERFELLDGIFADMSAGNKLNALLYDGEYMYVHSNYENSLYFQQTEGGVVFATSPLGKGKWQLMPITTLTAYSGGEKVFTGRRHGNIYKDNPDDLKYLFQAYSGL
ncbi:MAG: class II glutamine amidotransferase [Clostridia bacterium]|nr:class II glutamine amidotransferase [Clostridia bacterium]